MLKTIATIVTLAATPLAAESDSVISSETDHCKQMGGMAAQIMEARQAGVTLSKTIEIVSPDDLLEALALAAYQVPRWRTPENQRMAVIDFRNEVEVMCYGEGT